jgi:hypothetical protein
MGKRVSGKKVSFKDNETSSLAISPFLPFPGSPFPFLSNHPAVLHHDCTIREAGSEFPVMCNHYNR